MDTNTARIIYGTIVRYGSFVPKPLLVAAAVVALMVWSLYMTVTFFHHRRPKTAAVQTRRESRPEVTRRMPRRASRGGINYHGASAINRTVAMRTRAHGAVVTA